MKITPKKNHVIGRVVIKRTLSNIVRPDETKETTKFVLVDAVGPGAAEQGLKVGDVILPTKMSIIKFDGGMVVRPMVHADDSAAIMDDITLADLAVQTDSGTEYVPIDSEKAAKSLAESPIPESRSAVAA